MQAHDVMNSMPTMYPQRPLNYEKGILFEQMKIDLGQGLRLTDSWVMEEGNLQWVIAAIELLGLEFMITQR